MKVLIIALLAAITYAQTGQRSRKIISGTDHRTDVYLREQLFGADDTFVKIAKQSVVALMAKDVLGPEKNGFYHPKTTSLTDNALKELNATICPTEKFLSQTANAFCSGTLVDSKHIYTAGHCIDTKYANCETMRIVFNYYVTGKDVKGNWEYAPIRKQDVYHCKNFLQVWGLAVDYAMVELDREVTGHVPVAEMVTSKTPRTQGETVGIIGFGAGLPMKIDLGGIVNKVDLNGQLNKFSASLDTTAGNSGSGVFDMQGRLIAIHTDGRVDFSDHPTHDCKYINRYSHSHPGTENNVYLHNLENRCYDQDDCPKADEICGNMRGGIGQCVPIPTDLNAPLCPSGGRSTCCVGHNNCYDEVDSHGEPADMWCCEGMMFCSHSQLFVMIKSTIRHCNDTTTQEQTGLPYFVLNITFQESAGGTGEDAVATHVSAITQTLSRYLDCNPTDITATPTRFAGLSANIEFEVKGKREKEVRDVVQEVAFEIKFPISLIANGVAVYDVTLIDASWDFTEPSPAADLGSVLILFCLSLFFNI